MFNGIIYNQGKIKNLIFSKNGCQIEIFANKSFNNLKIGSSISCDGVCLTLTKKKLNSMFFYLSKETLYRSTFKKMRIGRLINMEQSLKLGDDISGPFVQGHVDCTGVIKKISILKKVWTIRVSIPNKYYRYIAEKGSIVINGVSLTVSKIIKNNFEITIIPHTLKITNLINLKVKNEVNVEFDMFSKYLFKLNN